METSLWGSVAQYLAATIALAALAVTAVFQWQNTRRQMDAVRFTETMKFMNEWRQELWDHRRHINEVFLPKLRAKPVIAEGGYQGLEPEDKKAIESVSHFLDHMGWVLVAGGIDRRLLFTFLGPTITRLWKELRPLVEAERRIRESRSPVMQGGRHPGPYQDGFRLLADFADREYENVKLNAWEALWDRRAT